MATAQQSPNASPEALVSGSSMELLRFAIQNNSAIDVIERLAALQEKAIASEAEMEFNDALNRAQAEITRIAPDLQNPQTSSKYASYAALDKVIRPVYIREGLNLSFDTDDSPKPEHVRVLCYVSRGRHTRTYKTDMPCDGKGAKGGDVMTKTHATAGAASYGMRYLLKMIFNVAIGEADKDGNSPVTIPGKPAPATIPEDRVQQNCTAIAAAKTKSDCQRLFMEAYRPAYELNDRNAMATYIRVKDARKRELQ